MPEMFDGRAVTTEGSPKPPRLGGAQGATNAEPSARGTAAGGTDNMRTATSTLQAADSRPTTSPLRATRAAVSSFDGSKP